MKKINLLFLLYSSFFFAQQTKTITIDWQEGKYPFSNGTSITIPYFKENFTYNDSKQTLLFSQVNEVGAAVKESSLRIVQVEFESISPEKLGNLSKVAIPSEPNFAIRNSKAREQHLFILSFSPIIKEGNSYKKIKSVTYSFEYDYLLSSRTSRNANSIVSSVLKEGVWKRFSVTKSGVYKISKAFLSEIGFDTNVDPRKIKIYGNGGRMVPLLNSIPYPNDLAENAISFIGEQDGVFNDSDYILFYAEGVDNWSDENKTTQNLYSDRSFYYVTASNSTSKRITPFTEPLQSATIIHTSYDETQYYEVDKNNFTKLGRTWYGEPFNLQNDQTFTFNFPNAVTTAPVSFFVSGVATASVTTTMGVKVNNQDLGTLSFPALPNTSTLATYAELSATQIFSGNSYAVALKYNNSNVPRSNAYLDFIRIKTKSWLKGLGKQFRFTVESNTSNIGTCLYQFSSATTISQVWDITDIYNVTSIANSGQADFSFKALMGTVKKYIAIDPADYYSPTKETDSSVPNLDLKGTVFSDAQGNFEDVDYLIVTPGFLKPQADRLATFHRQKSNLKVRVVTLDKLYLEFASGKQDIGAIRNFVKYIYDNASVPSNRIKYLCLFGDASFDFKDRIRNNTNIVPIYQSKDGFSLSSSFVSDDYFGLMDSDEGNMDSGFGGLDVAVGRILASDLTQAEQMVSKIISYYDEKSYGKWRNNITMISDDADKDSDHTLQVDLDRISDRIYAEKPFINVKKIHADAYVQETTSGGHKYPKVREDFVNSFEQGTLLVNYFGHGGEDGLAHERIFEKIDATNLKNSYKLPLFMTVTCEFTKFDDPLRQTAGEFVYWNPDGGAVSMITTTRQIGQFTGATFNERVSQYLFAYGSNNYPTIAEAVRLSKNGLGNSGNNVVFYLGDPALKLAIPKPKIILTKINDVPVSGNTDALQALSYVKLTGEVVDEFNNPITNYNGELFVSVFDKEVNRTTLGNDNTIVGGNVFRMNFTTLGETIFRGNASVTNGQFEFGFVVPRDIKIPLGTGRVSFYAKNKSVLEDQTGYDLNIKVGGLNTNAVADTTPPRIRIYMNDTSFVSGGITNQNPLFLAFLEDEHGINTASGIGHDIVAYLDGDETKPYVLNDFYETELNDYTKGKLKYPFRNLALGLHTLTFKAWDVYNNIITAELQFVVVSDESITLQNVLNYPNPFVNHTEFWFTHNKPFEPLDVQVQVLTITGKVVWSKNQVVVNEGFTSRDITWDGRDDFGDKIGKGVYVYKLTVRSTLTNKKVEKFEKLVIL